VVGVHMSSAGRCLRPMSEAPQPLYEPASMLLRCRLKKRVCYSSTAAHLYSEVRVERCVRYQ
jgi:hypothetical protein